MCEENFPTHCGHKSRMANATDGEGRAGKGGEPFWVIRSLAFRLKSQRLARLHTCTAQTANHLSLLIFPSLSLSSQPQWHHPIGSNKFLQSSILYGTVHIHSIPMYAHVLSYVSSALWFTLYLCGQGFGFSCMDIGECCVVGVEMNEFMQSFPPAA